MARCIVTPPQSTQEAQLNTRNEVNTPSAGTNPAVIFTSCELIDAAEPMLAASAGAGSATPAAAAKRREVMVKGRRVKTIDVHAHCIIPAAMKVLGQDASRHHEPAIVIVPQDRLRVMDEQGIDVEALSINPYWYGADRDKVPSVSSLSLRSRSSFPISPCSSSSTR
jgi:aminocarboxymuconate-semialdehyde decarboxylase